MEKLPLERAFTLIEPGPVTLITTHDGHKDNIMTITWTMVLDFSASFAIATGPWNHSYAALENTRECVIALPAVDLLDQVIGVGTCSGRDTDKFERFGLTRSPANQVHAPLIQDCLANIECRVSEIIAPYGIVVLQGIEAWINPERTERHLLHAVGDGTFTTDGRHYDRREMMRNKLPPGV